MQSTNSFKQKLIVTTALAMTGIFGGYGRQAYAACVANPVAPDYLCSGYTTTTQTITVDNANVITDATFDINVAAGSGVVISGKGEISFTDNYASSIISANAYGLVLTGGGDDGATAGSVTISLTGDVEAQAYAIQMSNSGTGASILNTTGKVTSKGQVGITVNSWNASSTDLTINAANVYTLSGGGLNLGAVDARHAGMGDLQISISGNVYGGRTAIEAHNNSLVGGALSVYVGGNVKGAIYRGIDARQYGLGATTVVVNGDVTAAHVGLIVRDWAANTAGDMTIHTKGTVTSTGNRGLEAIHRGMGHMYITMDGDVTAQTEAIRAMSTGGSGMTVNTSGNITSASSTAVYLGIVSGDTSMTATGDISGARGVAVNSNSGGDVVLDFQGNLTGSVGYGLFAWAGSGDLTVNSTKLIKGEGFGAFLNAANVDANIASVENTGSGTALNLAAQYGVSLTVQNITSLGEGLGVDVGGKLDVTIHNIDAQDDAAHFQIFGSSDTAKIDITGDVKSADDYGIEVLSYSSGYNAARSLNVLSNASVSTGGATAAAIRVMAEKDNNNPFAVNIHGTVENTAGGLAISSYGQYWNTALDINIHGGRVIGDIRSFGMPGYTSMTAVNILGDFTSEGDIDVEDVNVNAGATFTLGNGYTITSKVDAVDIAGRLLLPYVSGITGDVNVVKGGVLDVQSAANIVGALRNSGNITISAGNALTVDTMSAGSAGTLVFDVASASSHGQLIVAAGAADMTGQTVSVNMAPADTLADGDELLIIDGTSTVIGGPGAGGVDVKSNSPIWSFSMLNGTEVTGGDDSQLYLITKKAAPAAQIEVDGAIVAATLTFADGAMNLTGERLSLLRRGVAETGVSAGNSSSGTRVWAQALGQHIDQKMRKGVAGYDANLYGGSIGMDTDSILQKGVLGLAFSYGHSKIKSHDMFSSRTDINSYQMTFYGDYNWDNGVYVEGMNAYAVNKNDKVRHNAGGAGLDARSSFDSYDVAVRGEVGRTFATGAAFVTPFAMANWLYYTADSYSEAGAGAANLRVKSEDMNQIDLGLGAKLGMTMASINGSVFVPELHVVYRREMLGDKLSTTQSYIAGGGPAVVAKSPDPARDKLTLGTRMKYFSEDGFELTAAYDFELKEDFTSHTGLLRAGWTF